MKTERYTHHGVDVVVISHLKGRHREHCLCFQGCRHFKPGTPENCAIAQATYENCVKFGTTTPVFECPKYEATPEWSTENEARMRRELDESNRGLAPAADAASV